MKCERKLNFHGLIKTWIFQTMCPETRLSGGIEWAERVKRTHDFNRWWIQNEQIHSHCLSVSLSRECEKNEKVSIFSSVKSKCWPQNCDVHLHCLMRLKRKRNNGSYFFIYLFNNPILSAKVGNVIKSSYSICVSWRFIVAVKTNLVRFSLVA